MRAPKFRTDSAAYSIRCGVFAALALLAFSTAALPSRTELPQAGTRSVEGADSTEPTVYVFGSRTSAASREFRKQVLSSIEFINYATNVNLVELDVEANRDVAESFAVTGVPTLVIATEEGKIVARHAGAMPVTELKEWIEAGRKRIRDGLWEGTAATPALAKLVSGTSQEIGTNELQQLIGFLANPDPAIRSSAARVLVAQREAAMPALIEAAGDVYLGTRIAAGEIIESLAPGAPVPNPWLSRDEARRGVVALKEWWERVRKLPPAGARQPVSAEAQATISAAVVTLLEENPARRTDAMSRLVASGTAALPAIRKAIQQRERAGDQRSLSLLEDVRWAILVPNELEQRTPGLRRTLARGISGERQEAARNLTRAGAAALPALVELASDADPLVVESTLGSLSAAGGAEAISAMAALLKSPDANLRLTAAQSLGRSKDAAAVTPLVQTLGDADELVVVAALGALDQVLSRESSSSKKLLPPELAAGMRPALSDSRWRVRATAAEVAGKLKMNELEEPLKKLLDDRDGFVVKNALAALQKIGTRPEPDELLVLARRLPALRGDVIQAVMSFRSAPAVKAVDELYTQSSGPERAELLRSIAGASDDPQSEGSIWEALVERSVTDSDPQVRRAGAAVLPGMPKKVSARLVQKFIRDEDAEVVTAAAGAVIGLVSGKSVRGFMESEMPQRHYFYGSMSDDSGGATNAPAFATNETALLHTLLLGRREAGTNAIIAAAAFVTGEGTNNLPLVLSAFGHADEKAQSALDRLGVAELLLPRLAGDAGEMFVTQLEERPVLYVQAMCAVGQVEASLAARLSSPERFLTVFGRAPEKDQKRMIQTMVSSKAWSRWQRAAPSFAPTLAASPNSLMRSVAVNALGDSGTNYLELILSAAKDTNAWVRLAALRSLARVTDKPDQMEARLAPMLSDPDLRVARLAAVGLLEPEVRNAVGRSSWLNDFEFEGVGGMSRSYSYSSESERPLMRLESKPPWLEEARKQFAREPGDNNAPFAVLLAQFGEFEALDQLIGLWRKTEARDRTGMMASITTGIALSRDAKYVGVLRQMVESTDNSWEWRQVLQGLRGMTGSEARQLRVEVNRRIREGGQ